MKRHAIAIVMQDTSSHIISYGLDFCMLDLDRDINKQIEAIATQKAVEWWNYDKNKAFLYAEAKDVNCKDEE